MLLFLRFHVNKGVELLEDTLVAHRQRRTGAPAQSTMSPLLRPVFDVRLRDVNVSRGRGMRYAAAGTSPVTFGRGNRRHRALRDILAITAGRSGPQCLGSLEIAARCIPVPYAECTVQIEERGRNKRT